MPAFYWKIPAVRGSSNRSAGKESSDLCRLPGRHQHLVWVILELCHGWCSWGTSRVVDCYFLFGLGVSDCSARRSAESPSSVREWCSPAVTRLLLGNSIGWSEVGWLIYREAAAALRDSGILRAHSSLWQSWSDLWWGSWGARKSYLGWNWSSQRAPRFICLGCRSRIFSVY